MVGTTSITSDIARHKVNVLMLENIGNLLHGDAPTLLLTDRTYRQVPIILSTPCQGRIGQVGSVSVDAETGEVIVDDSLLENIANQARRLLASSKTTLK